MQAREVESTYMLDWDTYEGSNMMKLSSKFDSAELPIWSFDFHKRLNFIPHLSICGIN
jgi:hypothetical protein